MVKIIISKCIKYIVREKNKPVKRILNLLKPKHTMGLVEKCGKIFDLVQKVMRKNCRILMWSDFNYEKTRYFPWGERIKIGRERRESKLKLRIGQWETTRIVQVIEGVNLGGRAVIVEMDGRRWIYDIFFRVEIGISKCVYLVC